MSSEMHCTDVRSFEGEVPQKSAHCLSQHNRGHDEHRRNFCNDQQSGECRTSPLSHLRQGQQWRFSVAMKTIQPDKSEDDSPHPRGNARACGAACPGCRRIERWHVPQMRPAPPSLPGAAQRRCGRLRMWTPAGCRSGTCHHSPCVNIMSGSQRWKRREKVRKGDKAPENTVMTGAGAPWCSAGTVSACWRSKIITTASNAPPVLAAGPCGIGSSRHDSMKGQHAGSGNLPWLLCA